MSDKKVYKLGLDLTKIHIRGDTEWVLINTNNSIYLSSYIQQEISKGNYKPLLMFAKLNGIEVYKNPTELARTCLESSNIPTNIE